MILEEESLEGICDQVRIMEVKIIEVDIEEIIEMIITRGRSRSRDKQYSDNTRRSDRSVSRSRWGSKASNNRDRIRCHKCREYDHFAKDCPTSKVEKESEQIQQIYNLYKEKTL